MTTRTQPRQLEDSIPSVPVLLRAAMKAYGWNQRELAWYLRTTPPSVTNWLRGQHLPAGVMYAKIVTAFSHLVQKRWVEK